MRLTQKGTRRHNFTWPSSEKVLVNREEEMNQYNKLSQLEDIEEELGIDLITIWKAKTGTFYFKNKLGKIYPVMFQSIDHITKCIHFTILDEQDIRNSCAFLKDYGKTWALTKKELK